MVPYDYNGAKIFPSPIDIVAVVTSQHVCSDVVASKPTALPVV